MSSTRNFAIMMPTKLTPLRVAIFESEKSYKIIGYINFDTFPTVFIEELKKRPKTVYSIHLQDNIVTATLTDGRTLTFPEISMEQIVSHPLSP